MTHSNLAAHGGCTARQTALSDALRQTVPSGAPRWTALPGISRWVVLLGAAVLAGCATVAQPDPRDPLQGYNRSMAQFNEHLDTMVLKPVATAYREVTPAPVRTGVSNFFANIGDIWSFVNNLLQLRGEAAAASFMRVNVNTFLGLGGLLDIASELNIERHKQDFGLTLGHWGVGTGPYLVLPLLGPSTLRDSLALSVDIRGNALHHLESASARQSLYLLRTVEMRANLLRAGAVLDSAALDKYSFTRDVFLQVRGQAAEANGMDDEDADNPSSEGMLPEEP
ncbi:MlaA family lipoprotein [Verminephrobacter eiseniae]|uniref:VacJ family lipoprotein n=1 Tax=Verminephrobacter eiseniae (strain EF01-2) TaxID=391735 RepID=A1WKI9_VEREI|nr:VacJ family lipoprotein [Verminephrobacter eiseniae]ABM58146.1 VacJ family lipoprotein [Verminephrobacter eiseniae EF01-2]MCW5263185.1 VacJ family lipoprotein [Verminephrobacter eiseniae]MCW5283750.1 VacJ family lipoprotein [Verminephrobacter eiseniae]MCW5301460.1 VacJ family lipoprotein [Verminephrobacter eiseniae]MCW8178402.1 VacJ family lipoprotein [Verminephrobacter eiseniae]